MGRDGERETIAHTTTTNYDLQMGRDGKRRDGVREQQLF